MNPITLILDRVESFFVGASSSNHVIFPFFIMLNLFTYLDRGIIPGASREFTAFAANAVDSPDFIQQNTDAGLGILQAGFILGYSVAIVICGHLVHTIPWKNMTLSGFSLWIIAVFLSALSFYFNSFFLLFTARIITGVSEASFAVIAPPMFQDRGGKRAGLWLSLYLSAMPLGVALGYITGSQVANASGLGWQWAFLLVGLLAFPVLGVGFLIQDGKNGGVFAPFEQGEQTENMNGETTSKLTMWQETKVCLESKSLLAIIAAQSICIAIVAVLSTFGGAFLLALGVFKSETKGASLFALTAAIGGILGTPVGGLIVDKVLDPYKEKYEVNDAEADAIDSTESRIDSLRQLTTLLPVTTGVVGIGIFLCYPTLFFARATPFLGFLFVGWFFLFASQAGITMSVMLSVPPSHRSNAIAFTTLMAHMFGDVPSPIIFGFLKDRMAPACIVTAEGNFADPERCVFEGFGVRLTIGMAYLYITLSLLFFEWARRLAMKELKRLEIINNGSGRITTLKELEMRGKKKDANDLFPVKNPEMNEGNTEDFEVIDMEIL